MRSDRTPPLNVAALSGALRIVLLAVTTAILSLTIQHRLTARLITDELEHFLRWQADALVSTYEREGAPGVKDGIQRALSVSSDRDAVYLLADGRGQALAGNLLHWPAGIGPGQDGRVTVTLRGQGGSQDRVVAAEARRLAPNLLLLVGHDAEDRMLLNVRYWTALAVSIALTSAVGLATARWVGR